MTYHDAPCEVYAPRSQTRRTDAGAHISGCMKQDGETRYNDDDDDDGDDEGNAMQNGVDRVAVASTRDDVIVAAWVKAMGPLSN